ncbi:hypothetical protein C8R47DRAFT_1151477 [Mycena vitilis]|nr:hypothetical protein C8R47DRAFT_1151477 [Mycena vitilis]
MTISVHPHLRLERLSLLPVSIRRTAKAAASGSDGAILRLCELIRTDSARRHLYLPAIYAILDPARIPAEDELDSENPAKIAPAVGQATAVIMALRAIAALDHSLPSFPHLWPRIFKWMESAMLYRYCLPPPIPSDLGLLSNFGETIMAFYLQQMSYIPLISATPNVRSLLTRLWVVSVADGNVDDLPGITYFIRNETFDSPSHLEEFAEGAGGTLADLCSLVVRHIDFLTSDPSSFNDAFFLQGIMLFTSKLSETPHLLTALLDCGLAFALARLLTIITRPELKYDAKIIIDYCFPILHSAIHDARGFRWLLEMLKGGIIPAIVTMSEQDRYDTANALLRIYFPAAMVSYRLVHALKQCLLAVGPLPSAHNVPFHIADDWKIFRDVAQHRISTMQSFESPEHLSFRACDNMECSIILPKFRFRRCSDCRRRVYCSRECQAVDWQDARHRTICPGLRASGADPATSRGRAFMVAVLHRIYEERKTQILLDQIKFMIENPETDFYLRFEVVGAGTTITVCALESLERKGCALLPGPDTDPLWNDYVARAKRSCGKMELHLLSVPEGAAWRSRIMPLRSSSSGIHDGLREIARWPAWTDFATVLGHITQEIENLLLKEADIVQIHCS